MFDAQINRWMKTPLARVARHAVARDLGADQMTYAGAVFAFAAMIAIALDWTLVGLGCFLINRLCDGLDGAIARLTQPTDAGAFLDITVDFLVYAGIVLAFAIRDPADALAAAGLLFSFIGTASTFLAFAIFAEKRKLTNTRLQHKSLYYLEGLTEGFETTLVFALMCLFPGLFSVFAWCFAALCLITAIGRIREGRQRLIGIDREDPDTLST